MENVSNLDKFFKLFQFIGLQCFSLNHLITDRKYPSVYYRFYLMFLLSWITTFGVWNFNNYIKNTSNNYLHVIIKFLNFVNYVSSINVCLLLSFFQHQQLLRFFSNSEKISIMSFNQFNHKTNFKKFKQNVTFWLIGFAMLLVKLFYDLFYSLGFSGNFSDYFESSCWWLIAVFVYAIVLRFNFYVRLINFHLSLVNCLIRENFLNKLSEVPVLTGKKIQLVKMHPQKYVLRKQILTLRKIFILIREMANIVNSTMGFLILMRLVMIITNMIRFGYDLLRNISAPIDVTCKINKTKHRLLAQTWFLNHSRYDVLDFYLWTNFLSNIFSLSANTIEGKLCNFNIIF